MSFYQLPEEMRPNVSATSTGNGFKFFQRVTNRHQAIMMVGLKFYIVEFPLPKMEVLVKKQIDLGFLEEKYPATDFSKIRDCQVLDDSKSYGFVTWKSPTKEKKQAIVEFFLYNSTGRTMYSYDSMTINVAPDLFRATD